MVPGFKDTRKAREIATTWKLCCKYEQFSIFAPVIFVVDELRLKPLPIVLIGDFNAHHPYWHGENGNKLGNELFEYLSDKDLSVMNSAQPTTSTSTSLH